MKHPNTLILLFTSLAFISGCAAKKTNVLSGCPGASKPEYRLLCEAVGKKDLATCKAITFKDGADTAEFQAQCATLVAAASKDTALCGKLHLNFEGFDNGVFRNSTTTIDCLQAVAVSSRDKKLCEKTAAPDACAYALGVTDGTIGLDACKDADCIFHYAFTHNSVEACEKLTPLYGEASTLACKAMLSGDRKMCEPITNTSQWGLCTSKTLYGKARTVTDEFWPFACGDDRTCVMETMADMADYIAQQK